MIVKRFAARIGFGVAWILVASACLAQDATPPNEVFKPFKLVGAWKFLNANTGASYGGDVEVAIDSIDGKGVMHGLTSYDGRQTNDKCSTKILFTDKPVEAEISKTDNGYRITFEVGCSTGKRILSWTLVCTEGRVCSQPTVLPWGKGMLILTANP